ncbi:MAG: carbon storage regulator CsrA [Planctomycetia bacterium]|nr:carbon storage regulator CsrA [Planctomycetia bacterium]
MLVLSRKVGETVRIAENIEVTVVEIKNGKVRLGFRCPKEVPILRQEVYDRGTADGSLSLIELAEPAGV